MRLHIAAIFSVLPALALAFEYPSFVPVEKRQAPGSPEYACHEDCGTVISLSKKDGFCNKDEFTSRLDDCLDCAEENNIWKYYESGVTAAAEACDLDAEPKPATVTPVEEPTETASSGSDNAASATTSKTVTETTSPSTSSSVSAEPSSTEFPPDSPSAGSRIRTIWQGFAVVVVASVALM